jgi:hypothetical protein
MLLNKVIRLLKSIPVQSLRVPSGRGNHIFKPSALECGKAALPTRKYFCYSFLLGYGAAGRINSVKHSSDTIGNGTRNVPACSAVG